MSRSHLAEKLCKIRLKKKENKDQCFYLYKILIANIHKVVELPFACLKRISTNESYVCLYLGQLFKS